jgi:hypothetical protein
MDGLIMSLSDADLLLAFLHDMPRYPDGELQTYPPIARFAAIGLPDEAAFTAGVEALVEARRLVIIPDIHGGADRWVLKDLAPVARPRGVVDTEVPQAAEPSPATLTDPHTGAVSDKVAEGVYQERQVPEPADNSAHAESPQPQPAPSVAPIPPAAEPPHAA